MLTIVTHTETDEAKAIGEVADMSKKVELRPMYRRSTLKKLLAIEIQDKVLIFRNKRHQTKYERHII